MEPRCTYQVRNIHPHPQPPRYRIARTGGIIILTFLFFWLPYYICSTLSTANIELAEWINNNFYCIYALIYFFPLVNPIIYNYNEWWPHCKRLIERLAHPFLYIWQFIYSCDRTQRINGDIV
jgi:hypothetical protein